MRLPRAMLQACLLALAAPCLAASAQGCTAQPLTPEALAAQGVAVEGDLTQAWACHDTAGEHLVIASRMASSDKQLGTQLLFAKLTKKTTSWKRDWQARDFRLYPGRTASSSEIVTIKDADGDGLAEVFIAYTLPGLTAASDEGKLLVYYKDHKYSIRGAVARTPDDFGSRNISPSYLTLPPAVQAQGLQIWDQLSLPAATRGNVAQGRLQPVRAEGH